MRILRLVLAISLLLAGSSEAATLYMGSGETYTNLQAAMAAMSSGDTLIIRDGTYTHTGSLGNDNYFTATYEPPDGPGSGSGDDRFTIIKAENDFAVTIDLTGSNEHFWQYSDSAWVKFQGLIIKSDVSGEAMIDQLSDGNHLFFKNCGFAKINSGGASISTVWIYGSYNLFEDCFFWGSGKYLLHDRGDHDVYRRCVFRPDNLNGGNQPCAAVMSYEGDYIEWQNIIILDADSNAWTNASYYLGAFATHHAADQDGTDYNYIRGSISVANDVSDLGGSGVQTSWWIDGTSSTNNEFHDVIAVGSTGGFTAPGTGYGNICVNCLSINLSDDVGTARGFNGFESIDDSISANNEVGVYNCPDADDTNVYGNDTDWSGSTHTNDISGDPESNGLLYPVRIESGSTLETAGSDSGRVGSNITKRIGVDGTFYGESGYNTTTETDLWPWPNETVIRSNMRTYSPGTLDGTRGFCAVGQTLTKYIWEYLGNSIPSDIYGGLTVPTASNLGYSGGGFK